MTPTLNKTQTPKRWNLADMQERDRQLFLKIAKKKRNAHHNHDIHFLTREIDDWLPQGIQLMIEGTYTPRPIKRYYFTDDTVDQLYIADRVLQHVLLHQLKPTFKYVMSPNCYHLH